MSEEASSVVAKLIDKLPDVHFDWYARFLPGAFILLCYRYTKGPPYLLEPSATKLLLFFGIAYLIGHILQPFASRCAVLSRLRQEGKKLEKVYLEAKACSKWKSQASKITKAHAESVSMFSMSFGAALIWMKLGIFSNDWQCRILIVSGFLLFAAVERVFARERKIEELKEMKEFARANRAAAGLYQQFLDKNPEERAAMEVWESAPLVDDVEPKKP